MKSAEVQKLLSSKLSDVGRRAVLSAARVSAPLVSGLGGEGGWADCGFARASMCHALRACAFFECPLNELMMMNYSYVPPLC